jgi:L-iditol 2-dehydrogenase
MKRAVLLEIGKLVLEDAPEPACPREGLVVKVKACAVCATDVKIYNYGHTLVQLPRVLGHEVAGVVHEVGPALQDRFQPGRHVAVCAVVNCGECPYCQRAAPSMCVNLRAFGYHFDGGYQEYMAVPAEAVRCGGVNVLPEDLPFTHASLAELLACCINGQRLSEVNLGQSMLILGAGPVGILHAQLAAARGAGAVYLADVNPAKTALAESICGPALAGTLRSDDPAQFGQTVRDITKGFGFDQVMICCSAPQAQQLALEHVAKCGCVNLFGGLPKGNSRVLLDTNHIHYKQCRVVGTHGSSAEDNRMALDLIARGRINVQSLITETIGLDRLESVLALSGADDRRLKAVVVF